jgi:hypothetical protein
MLCIQVGYQEQSKRHGLSWIAWVVYGKSQTYNVKILLSSFLWITGSLLLPPLIITNYINFVHPFFSGKASFGKNLEAE